MKNFKHFQIISILIAVVMSLSLLAACGSTDSQKTADTSTTAAPAKTEEPVKTAEPQKDVTLILAASQNWIKDVDRKLASDFTTKTGTKMDIQVNPDDQYPSILKTKIASGEAPDIFMVPCGLGMEQYMPEKNFADLSNEPWVSRYNTWAKTASSSGGKVVGLNTWGVDGWVMLYDPDVFAKYNVTVPNNYKEFLSICEIFKSKGIIPVYEPVKDLWHTPFWLDTMTALMIKEDPEVLNKLNAGQTKLADIAVLKTAMAQIKEVADKGYFGNNYMSDTWDKSYEILGTGKAAMFLGYTAYPSEVIAKFPQSNATKYKSFPVPFADNTTYTFNGGGQMRVMYKDIKNADSVKQYFSFLATAENLKIYYDERKDLVGCSFKDFAGNTTESYNSSLANADLSAVQLDASVKFYDLMSIGKHIQEMLIKGGISSDKALQAIDQDREKVLNAVAK